MTIAVLPSHTVRAIGSTQALTDSASLVKELVDNALDAQSTSVTVEISSNALDIIRVTDNGHGIAPIDRPLVCKRYCTSKINDLDDLAIIGGTSLGFRGEALASAVELSGALTVTTRIVGEATAVSLKLGQNGEVTNEERVSHAVGTTLRITDFLKSIPVRRQAALKDSAKQLAKVKRNLQAYAIARPSVRLSLKILNAKIDKGNWIYAPKSDASVLDAAVKVFGKKVTDQCRWLVWTPNTLTTEARASQGNGTTAEQPTKSTHRVEALLPISDADPTAISNVGQYVSVDSRPVSCTRGTLKQILQLYKSYLRSSCKSSTDQKITDPFLCINLVCPPGSYDANVEPAKDDVLFANTPGVLEMLEAFLKSHYGEIQSKPKRANSNKSAITNARNFDLLLAKKPPLASVSIAPALESPASKITGPDRVPARSQRPADEIIIDQIGGVRHWVAESSPEGSQSSPTGPDSAARSRGALYLSENEDALRNDSGPLRSHDPEDEDGLGDINISNPWTFAKLNAPTRPQRPTASGANSVSRNQQLLTPAKQHGSLGDDLFSPELPSRSIADPNFPTPARSQDGRSYGVSSPETFPYPMKRWGKVRGETDSRRDSSPDEEHASPTRLDTWIQRPPPHSDMASQESSQGRTDLVSPRPHHDFLPASELPLGTPLNAIPDISQARRRKGVPRKQQFQTSSKAIHKPFKAPTVQDPAHVWFDHLDNSSARPSNPNKGRTDNPIPSRAPNHILSDDADAHDPIIDDEVTSTRQQQHQHPGLIQTMDYEARKAAAIAQRRALLRQQASSQLSADQSRPFPSPNQGTQIKTSASQQSSSSVLFSSPHRNRYNSAIAALHTSPGTNITPNSNTALPLLTDAATTSPHVATESDGVEKLNPQDPRAYLMRSQKTNDGRVKRIKSGLLPLETPSTNPGEGADGVRDLTQTIDTVTLLSRLRPSSTDDGKGHPSSIHFSQKYDDVGAFENLSVDEAKTWEAVLPNTIRKRYLEKIADEFVAGIDLVALFIE
ncbi:MAG: hypothetical protein LQ349_001572 [Xanthoria aureola]|nr:MAG: hypothetical protein LQ349_001572 [Xanthoria aureola]